MTTKIKTQTGLRQAGDFESSKAPGRVATEAATTEIASDSTTQASRAELEAGIAELMSVVPGIVRLLKHQVYSAGAAEGNEEPQASTVADLSISQAKVLSILGSRENSECVMSYLARHFNVTGPTMTRIVDGLVDKGYVERWRNEEDHRCVYVTLTDTGIECRSQLHKRYGAALRDFLRPLSDEQLATVVLAGRYLGALLPQTSRLPDS